MKTLLELLAEELDEWPEYALCVTQDRDGCVDGWSNGYIKYESGTWHAVDWNTTYVVYLLSFPEPAEDLHCSIITREMWEEARK